MNPLCTSFDTRCSLTLFNITLNWKWPKHSFILPFSLGSGFKHCDGVSTSFMVLGPTSFRKHQLEGLSFHKAAFLLLDFLRLDMSYFDKNFVKNLWQRVWPHKSECLKDMQNVALTPFVG